MPDLTGQLPSALRTRSNWARLAGVPALLAHPDEEPAEPVPLVIWMHGRTVSKEIDPGRYLRWIRAGFGACALDLPGHGERYDEALQQPDRTLDVVMQMSREIDDVIDALAQRPEFDTSRIAIGGMSAGGMAAIRRLTDDHPFRCLTLEATTGSWSHQRERAMFRHLDEEAVAAVDPAEHLERWREIPVLAIHSRLDEWVDFDGQRAFTDALRARYRDADLVDLVAYDQTGAPFEHAGFGRLAADAKDRQRDFLARHLLDAANS